MNEYPSRGRTDKIQDLNNHDTYKLLFPHTHTVGTRSIDTCCLSVKRFDALILKISCFVVDCTFGFRLFNLQKKKNKDF